MEQQIISHNVPVFGTEVKTFPKGIASAFDELVSRVPGGFSRSYYGISFMENDQMRYFATAEEKFPGEGKQLGYETLVIDQGEYASVTLHEWRSKTDQVKDIFSIMQRDPRVDRRTPAVEWYKNEEEMVCLVKLKS